MSRTRFAGYMHPVHAVRFPYRPDPPRRVQRRRSALLAAIVGAALAAVLSIGLSGGLRP